VPWQVASAALPAAAAVIVPEPDHDDGPLMLPEQPQRTIAVAHERKQGSTGVQDGAGGVYGTAGRVRGTASRREGRPLPRWIIACSRAEVWSSSSARFGARIGSLKTAEPLTTQALRGVLGQR